MNTFVRIAGVLLLVCTLTAVATETVCLEAESAATVVAPMRSVDRNTAPPSDVKILAKASGNGYLEIPQGAGDPPEQTNAMAIVNFSVQKAGEYYLWCRALWYDQCGNSVSMSIDGQKPFTFGQNGTYEVWHWVKSPPRLKQLVLSAGPHKLTIGNREDGIRIDQILFTSNRRLVPVDIEKVTHSP